MTKVLEKLNTSSIVKLLLDHIPDQHTAVACIHHEGMTGLAQQYTLTSIHIVNMNFIVGLDFHDFNLNHENV